MVKTNGQPTVKTQSKNGLATKQALLCYFKGNVGSLRSRPAPERHGSTCTPIATFSIPAEIRRSQHRAMRGPVNLLPLIVIDTKWSRYLNTRDCVTLGWHLNVTPSKRSPGGSFDFSSRPGLMRNRTSLSTCTGSRRISQRAEASAQALRGCSQRLTGAAISKGSRHFEKRPHIDNRE